MKSILTSLFASLFLAGFALAGSYDVIADGDGCKKCKKGDQIEKEDEEPIADGDGCKRCKKGDQIEKEDEEPIAHCGGCEKEGEDHKEGEEHKEEEK